MENNMAPSKYIATFLINGLLIPILALAILLFFNDPLAPILVFLTGAIFNIVSIMMVTTGSNPNLKKNLEVMYRYYEPLNSTLAVSRIMECVLIIGLIGVWMPSFIGLSVYLGTVVVRFLREYASYRYVSTK